MSVLLLSLSGPMQSWGETSRFTVRLTQREPTKSGVLGLIAASLGRGREEPLDDLAQLEFGVRVDQPGEMMRDFQTERTLDGGKSMPLSNRYYLADAKFLAAVGGDRDLILRIEYALVHPVWPLYLGRRSCPADQPVLHVAEKGPYDDVRTALAAEPWIASEWYRRRCASRFDGSSYPDLEIVYDARPGEVGELHADVPVSFGAVRSYGQRCAVRAWISNPSAPPEQDKGCTGAASVNFENHDPMAF